MEAIDYKKYKTPAIIAGAITGLLALFILIYIFSSDDDQVLTDIRLIYVPGGTFMMGCTAEQGGDCYSDERPMHQVKVDDFYIGKYEVRQAQWKAVTGRNPSYDKRDYFPVENVSWEDIVGTSGDYMTIRNIQYYADGFIYKLNKRTGRQYRLPTEAEWEYAARGGADSQGYKYSGGNTLSDVGWHEVNSGAFINPVGIKWPNELGIYDMSGNVWEWCGDWYGPYSSNPQTSPTGFRTGNCRVIRGGAWNNVGVNCRVSNRSSSMPGHRSDNLGFRLACESK